MNLFLVSRNVSATSHIQSVIQWIIRYLLKLNLFAMNGNPVRERQITRLYLIVLIIAMSVLFAHNILADQSTLTASIQSPPRAMFENLTMKYPTLLSMLKISCILLKFCFHHCRISSDLLDRALGNAGYDNVSSLFPNINDFRRQAVVHFQLLGLFCQLASDAINDAITEFGLNQFLTEQPLEITTFDSQIETYVRQFQSSVAKEFVHQLSLVRQTTQGNSWLTLYTSNWRYVVRETSFYSTVFTSPIMFGNCLCATDATCSQSAGIYNNETFIEFVGFRIGCYPLEAFLQSSLSCLFNSSCVDSLNDYFPSFNASTPPMQVLAKNQSSQYRANTTLGTLVNQLFVEQWTSNSSYDVYFNQCAPASCTYRYPKENNFLNMITILLGLAGGLTIVLQILVPLAFYLVMYIYESLCRLGHSVAPTN